MRPRSGMKIGELARHAGVSTRTLRYYESLGLLPPPARTPAGYRLYQPHHLERVTFIHRAKGLGLSLEEIRGIIDLRERGQPPCQHLLALLDRKILEIDQALDTLKKFRDELARLRRRSAGEPDTAEGSGTICSIIEKAVHIKGEQALAWLEAHRRRQGAPHR